MEINPLPGTDFIALTADSVLGNRIKMRSLEEKKTLPSLGEVVDNFY